MKKDKNLQFSLRSYFVLLFVFILAITCFLGLCLVALLKLVFALSGGLGFWIGIYTLVIMLIGSLIMWQGSLHLTKPIRQLNEAVKQVSKGHFSVKIVRKSYPKDKAPYHNEIDELSQNFNKMADDLKQVAELRRDFISNVSHELKTPVASLVGLSDLLASGQLEERDRNELLEIMQSETLRLSRLCDDILNLSRLDKGNKVKKEELRLDEQLRHALILLTEKWKEKDIAIDFQSYPIRIVTDPDLSMQIWINLIDNAIKYSAQKVDLKISIEKENEGVWVSIEDQGYGIAQEDQDRVFEQFYQSDQSHAQEGNGLGLAIVKRIVELLDGEITFVSQLGKGTCFQVYLPLK
ncbi:HAMP domain-containing sensor histidine kinase [Streptococcus catagoni]|uniref:HAMP domain-containing sensor histidine kinase n=1 Tax=Streptococcus catagoni TaxID=2654874 RepID=UPI00140CC18C|nr:HAMP domain-containing sensor histidine kinase [Streptococcus catagoni]